MTAKANPQAINDDAYPDELRPGTELLHGQYVIEKFLNSGGFGITYLAKDSLDRTVVIKECFPGSFCRRSDTIVCVRSRAHQNEFQSIVKLFVQEAKNLAKLKHPNIVGVHQIFEDNDTAYMALDYVNGRDMLDILEDPNDALTPSDIQSMTLKLLGAVEYIHRAGVLHRDISPDNILLDRSSNNPVLIDFGAAREEATRQTRMLSAMRVVKDGYSPQEFYIQGSQQTPSSDLYALGATLYHAITGECPPDSQSRLAAIAAQKPDPFRAFPPELPGYNPKFLKAINKAMNIFPYDRIQSASEWIKTITPEPEIVALPSNKVRPVRPKIPTADASDLSDHAAAKAGGGQQASLPVPAAAAAPVHVQPRDPGEDSSNTREALTAKSAGKSRFGIYMGTVAAVCVAGIVGAIYLLPDETLSGFGGATQQAQITVSDTEVQDAPTELAVAPQDLPEAAPAPAAIAEPETKLVLSVPEPRSTPVEAPANAEVNTAAAPEIQTPAAQPIEDVTETETQTAVSSVPVLTLDLPAAPAEPVDVAQAPAPAEEAPAIVVSAPSELLTESPTIIGATTPVQGEVPQVAAKVAAPGPALGFELPQLPASAGSDVLPNVDIATAAPIAEKPSLTPEVKEASAVMTGWTVDLPFTAGRLNPGTIASVREGADSWLRPGQKIVSVNGMTVASVNDIPDAVRKTVDISGKKTVTVDVMVQDAGSSSPVARTLTLGAARSTALLNGFQFTTAFQDGEWRTIVETSPDTDENALRAGDRLVAYIPTSERLDNESALAEILERELGNGTSQFAFAVNRDGELWVASLGCKASGSN